MKSVLVLGPTGQIGSEVVKHFQGSYQVDLLSRADVDFTELAVLERLIEAKQPHIVVNAAAYTAVDNAEEELDKAFALSAWLPEMLAKVTARLGATLVHYSTDYVYGSFSDSALTEQAECRPVNVYGRSKLAGDQAVIAHADHFLVLRVSWIYSAQHRNFKSTMLKLAENNSQINVVNDQVGAPTPADFVARTTAQLIAHGGTGVYNLAPRGYTSWAGFAEAIFKQYGCTTRVNPIPTSAYPTPAKRQLSSRLDISKLEQHLNTQMPHWQEALAATETSFHL